MIGMNIEIGQKAVSKRCVADDLVIELGDPNILLRKYNLSHPRVDFCRGVGLWQIDHHLPRQDMDVSAASAVIRSGFSDPHARFISRTAKTLQRSRTARPKGGNQDGASRR